MEESEIVRIWEESGCSVTLVGLLRMRLLANWRTG